MEKKPKIFMECNLIFDNDTDMNLITKAIGIAPTSLKNKSEQRKSPFKDDNLEGYWSIQTNTFETFSLEDVTRNMMAIIKPHLDKMRKAVVNYDGSVDFMIVPEFFINDKPALVFDREFLDVVAYFNATVQIDMYVYEEDEDD